MNLHARLKIALEKDPTIVTTWQELELGLFDGRDESYLISLGLTKGDLLRLEREGLAMRGRMPTPRGHIVRWALMADSRDAQMLEAALTVLSEDSPLSDLSAELKTKAKESPALRDMIVKWGNEADEDTRTKLEADIREVVNGRTG